MAFAASIRRRHLHARSSVPPLFETGRLLWSYPSNNVGVQMLLDCIHRAIAEERVA